MIPVAAIFGAGPFLILADAIARLLLAPIEIPVRHCDWRLWCAVFPVAFAALPKIW
ncbi:MAG: hypothetical protein U0175_04800 [Caldilineaceae bacterium]